jgi:hypothetical protein
MSHIHFPHFGPSRELAAGNAAARPIETVRPPDYSGDSALDSALRAVPLPEGLMTRLGLLMVTMPEDMPDQVDWLGC